MRSETPLSRKAREELDHPTAQAAKWLYNTEVLKEYYDGVLTDLSIKEGVKGPIRRGLKRAQELKALLAEIDPAGVQVAGLLNKPALLRKLIVLVAQGFTLHDVLTLPRPMFKHARNVLWPSVEKLRRAMGVRD